WTNCNKPITSKTAVSCRPAKRSPYQRLPRRRQRRRGSGIFLDRQSLLFLEGLWYDDFFARLCLARWRGLEQTLPGQRRRFSIERDQFIVRGALCDAAVI